MPSPADAYRSFLLDLDGVIYRGDEPVPEAAEAVAGLRDLGRRVVFLTNNSARTPGQVAAKLETAGVPAPPEDVVTSAQATAVVVEAAATDAGARTAYVVGERGIREALEGRGIEVLDGDPAEAGFVVVGWDRRADYERLRTASVLVRRGARLVATNDDPSYPAPGGELWPGAGALLAAVETASGRRAEVVGKPHRPLFDAAVARAGGGPALVVGDRIETDIAGAGAAGLDAALVLSGAAARADVLDHDAVPRYLMDDLRGLFEDRDPAAIRTADEDDHPAIRSLLVDAGLTPPVDRARRGRILVVGRPPVATASVEIRGPHAYLHSIAVRHRGRGLGVLVTAAAIRAATVGGAGTAYLVTETAEGFFAGLGFAPVGREKLPGWIGERSTECRDTATAMRRPIGTAGAQRSQGETG